MLVEQTPGTIARFVDFGQPFMFFVQDPQDVIQSCHYAGRLYETEELGLIRQFAQGCQVFLDVGCNMGNHALFFTKVLGARKVYAFEANPDTAKLLGINVVLNNATGVIDTSYLGIGLGEAPGSFNVRYPGLHNIGGARLVEPSGKQAEGAIPVLPYDMLCIRERPQFIKIDVEGMEMAVLGGMHATISRYHPRLFIEVDNGNRAAFNLWLTENDYCPVARFRRYSSNENFLIVHTSELAPAPPQQPQQAG